MAPPRYTHLVAVGACYIDTILTYVITLNHLSSLAIFTTSLHICLTFPSVPAYPSEDAKQRASSISKRRGGNCPNTLEVLQQLYPARPNHDEASDEMPMKKSPELTLLSTLPDGNSPDHAFIVNSFTSNVDTDSNTTLSTSNSHNDALNKSPINLNHTFNRHGIPTAASSYIVQSQTTNSRTIVNHNALDEMTVHEFQTAVHSILAATQTPKRVWFHFEGRIPDITLQCIEWLRSTFPSHSSVEATISVECEKPRRPGLEDLAGSADVVFYSRSWAEGQGYTSAPDCLAREARRIASTTSDRQPLGSSVTLCCTWGAEGASALEFSIALRGEAGLRVVDDQIVTRPAWLSGDEEMKVVDTVGAGDTWIAGMLFCLISRPGWELVRKVDFANELAGRKIVRDGFGGLGREMLEHME